MLTLLVCFTAPIASGTFALPPPRLTKRFSLSTNPVDGSRLASPNDPCATTGTSSSLLNLALKSESFPTAPVVRAADRGDGADPLGAATLLLSRAMRSESEVGGFDLSNETKLEMRTLFVSLGRGEDWR